MSYYVYILYSSKTDKYYTGYSENVDLRLIKHNLGATPSTRPGRPWIIAYKEECQSKTHAIIREREIKSKKSRSYIEFLIGIKK
jgi:putative endonuclease